MKTLAFAVLALASQSAMARQGENTLLDMNAVKYYPPMYRMDCQLKDKEGKPISVHIENKESCSDIDGTWTSEVSRK